MRPPSKTATILWIAGITGVISAQLAPPNCAAADAKPGKPPVRKSTVKDVRKGFIESPVKTLFAKSRTYVAPKKTPKIKDMGKRAIENPVKGLIARTRPGTVDAKRTPKKTGAFKNPAVKPGDVRWHSDFNAAIAKARRSRKPVLLFQLIGRLDQRFS